MVEQAKASPELAATEYFAALKSHDLDMAETFWHDEVVDDFVAIGKFYGKDMVRGFFTELFGALPDFDLEILHVVSDEEHAVVQWRATGTFTGTPFQGIHASGRSVELEGCDVMRFEDGKLRHNTIYYDGLDFARQIGMLPREGSSVDRAMTAAFNAGTDVKARLRRTSKPPVGAG